MTKEELSANLRNDHQRFIAYIDALDQREFEFGREQKWTPGQELDHIIRSVLPISQILGNKSFIATKFGSIDRMSLNYDELVDMYRHKLNSGGRAVGQFVPGIVCWNQKEELKNQLIDAIERINSSLETYSALELTTLVLPHPLLGKLTVKEMIFFTIYHVRHHLKNSLRNLDG